MKSYFFTLMFGLMYISTSAQTNTFPASGNVGIGTTSPLANLQINSDLNGISAISIGAPNTPGNINVPVGGSPGGYNIDFYTWRDIWATQIGARIRAERINNYLENNALVQGMDLCFYTSHGDMSTAMTEKMRINYLGNVGIGTATPKAKLDIVGSVMIQSLLDNKSVRPSISSINIPGEVRVYSAAGRSADDGFLRLSSGAGTNPGVLSYIDISSHSTVPDMDRNIVFGTNGSEKVRIVSTGNVGIGTANPTEKLSVNGNIRAREIKVENTSWPDYVFKKDYPLPSLAETEHQIKENGHLSGIPSASEVAANGVDLGDMNAKLLKKIEELTLYLIELKKENQTINERLLNLERNPVH